MTARLKNSARFRLYRLLSKRTVYHSLFWLIVFIILVISDLRQYSFGFSLLVEFINITFYASIVYFNLNYLLPNYLSEKQFWHYGLLLLLAAAVITPIKILIFYFLFQNDPATQNMLLANQFYIFLTIFVVGGASSITKIVTDWLRHQRERKELQTQTMQSELRFLKSQINPHFLFNTLNNLYALTLKKSDKAPEIVIKLSEMMRYMLYECNEKRVPLHKEVKYIQNYLDLERLRQGGEVKIGFEVEGQVEDQKIAPLMFIPFLENSFKHGLSHQIDHGFVNVRMSSRENEVHFFIENSKPEKLPLPERRRVGGIGLVNVRRRLNLLYPDQYDLKIIDSPHSYAVDLHIRLE